RLYRVGAIVPCSHCGRKCFLGRPKALTIFAHLDKEDFSMNLEREIAHDLLSIGAVFLRPDEPFTWASGIKSPIYCDNRLTLTAPAVRTAVEKGLVELIRTHYPDAEVLMGTSTAG
ncbi:50S ribosomal protein L17, partial [Dysosmobacter welbionis]